MELYLLKMLVYLVWGFIVVWSIATLTGQLLGAIFGFVAVLVLIKFFDSYCVK